MGIFSREKVSSEEAEELKKRIIIVSTDVEMLKSKLAALSTNMTSLRSTVNRNFGDEEETKDLKEGVILPDDHGLA